MQTTEDRDPSRTEPLPAAEFSTSHSETEQGSRKRTRGAPQNPWDILTETFPALSESLRANACLLNCPAEDFERQLGFEDFETHLRNKVQLLAWDPPYNTRRERGQRNSDYDFLPKVVMAQVVALGTRLLRPGGHGIIFCSIAQFEQWKSLFEDYEDILCDPTPLHLVRAKNMATSKPFYKTTTLMNIVEYAVHITKRGAGVQGFGMVSYRPQGFVDAHFPGHMNVIAGVKKPLAGEVVKEDDSGSILRAEQKSLDLMREIVARFSMPKDIVVDLFSGVFTTAVACLTMGSGNARRFYGCEKDEKAFKAGFNRVLYTFVNTITSGDVEVDPSTVKMEAEIWLSESGESVKRGVRPIAPTPSGLPSFTRLPPHILSFLASRWRSREPLGVLRQSPVCNWPAEWQQRFSGLLQQDVESLLSCDASHFKVYVAESTIPDAGLGVFAAERLKRGQIVGWYGGSIMYENLNNVRGKNRDRSGGHPLWGCTLGHFRKFAIQLTIQSGGDRRLIGRSVFLVPRLFCVGAYLNDGTRGSTAGVNVKTLDREIADVESLTKPFVVTLSTTKCIQPGEELLVDYGADYWSS